MTVDVLSERREGVRIRDSVPAGVQTPVEMLCGASRLLQAGPGQPHRQLLQLVQTRVPAAELQQVGEGGEGRIVRSEEQTTAQL